jgi:hypothetical protein
MLSPEEQLSIIKRCTVEIIEEEELLKKTEGRKTPEGKGGL